MGIRSWLRGEQHVRVPRDDEIVEVAWLPLWQAHLVAHGLWEAEIPNSIAEDHTSNLRFAAREPMGRIFVMGMRLEAARAAIKELTGDDPITQHR